MYGDDPRVSASNFTKPLSICATSVFGIRSPAQASPFHPIFAEGYERGSNKEVANFLNYAKGSAGELRTQIYIGIEISYIDRETGHRWIQEAEEISRMLHGMIRAVRSRTNP